MKISFCTTCKGRLAHLSETLPKNLEAARGFDAEFVVLDYNCQDGTKDWVERNVHHSRVRVFRTSTPLYYDDSHAKNIIHRLAVGDILFSLDADNMVTPECIRLVLASFTSCRRTVLRGSGTHGRYGQIVLPRDTFHYLRGYDEALPPGWGANDSDLVERAVALGLALKRISPRLTRIIKHPDAMRMANFPVKNWNASNQTRQAARGRAIVANSDREWGFAADLKG